MWMVGVVTMTTVLASGLNSGVAESRSDGDGRVLSASALHAQQVSEARVWLDRGPDAVVQAGDRVRVYYRTETDAYVAIFQIDSDGTTRMQFPRSPNENHYARAGRDYRLLFPRSAYWNVDDRPGVGYFFIVTSPTPFDLSNFRYSFYDGGWDLSAVGSTVYSDPYVAMDEYVARLVPDWEFVDYGLDFISYSVGVAHEYPRFLCYQCHGFRPYSVWNPYQYTCLNFRVVVYDDPYFYPYRRYPTNRVVVVGPRNPTPTRFEFKERARGEPGTPVRVARGTRRTDGRPVTVRPEADARVGGGRVAAPAVPRPNAQPAPRSNARPTPRPSTRSTPRATPTPDRGSADAGSSSRDAPRVRPDGGGRATSPPDRDRSSGRPSLEPRAPSSDRSGPSRSETARPTPTQSRPSTRPSPRPSTRSSPRPRAEPSSRSRSSGSGTSTSRPPQRSNASSSARPAPRERSAPSPAKATGRPPARRPRN